MAIAYHVTAALFSQFDPSHLLEGEGNFNFGRTPILVGGREHPQYPGSVAWSEASHFGSICFLRVRKVWNRYTKAMATPTAYGVEPVAEAAGDTISGERNCLR